MFNHAGDQVHRFDKDGSLTTCDASTGKIISNEKSTSNPFDIDFDVASSDDPNLEVEQGLKR